MLSTGLDETVAVESPLRLYQKCVIRPLGKLAAADHTTLKKAIAKILG